MTVGTRLLTGETLALIGGRAGVMTVATRLLTGETLALIGGG
jgi:hypothetical protein